MKIKEKTTFIVILVLVLNIGATRVQSQYTFTRISSDTTWSISDSPVILLQSVIVEPDIILTIEPGVIVKFGSGISLTIDGTLNAQGNNEDWILFTSNSINKNKGDWNGITLRVTSSNNILKYTIIEYGGIDEVRASLNVIETNLIIDNVIFRENICGLYIAYTPRDNEFTINNCTFTNNDMGAHVVNDFLLIWGFPEHYDFTINNCTFTNNDIGMYTDSGYFEIMESDFSYNRVGVKIRRRVSIYASYTDFSSNEIAISSEDGDSLSMFKCNVVYNVEGIEEVFTVQLTECNISFNEGTGIFTSSGYLTIENSIITYNYNHGIVYEAQKSSPKEIHNSRIYGNQPFDIYYGVPFGSDMNATNNWWGTTNEELIKENIFDYYDNPDFARVLYRPFKQSEPEPEPEPESEPEPSPSPSLEPEPTPEPELHAHASILRLYTPSEVYIGETFLVILTISYDFTIATYLSAGISNPETEEWVELEYETLTGEGIAAYRFRLIAPEEATIKAFKASVLYYSEDEWIHENVDWVESFNITVIEPEPSQSPSPSPEPTPEQKGIPGFPTQAIIIGVLLSLFILRKIQS